MQKKPHLKNQSMPSDYLLAKLAIVKTIYLVWNQGECPFDFSSLKVQSM